MTLEAELGFSVSHSLAGADMDPDCCSAGPLRSQPVFGHCGLAASHQARVPDLQGCTERWGCSLKCTHRFSISHWSSCRKAMTSPELRGWGSLLCPRMLPATPVLQDHRQKATGAGTGWSLGNRQNGPELVVNTISQTLTSQHLCFFKQQL